MAGEEDPKGFLDILRLQGQDGEVADSMKRLKATPTT
jgi:hypothetical protein